MTSKYLIGHLQPVPGLKDKRLIAAAVVIGLFTSLCPGPSFGILALLSLLFYLRRLSLSWNDRRPFYLFLIGLSFRFFVVLLLSFSSILKGYEVTLFGDSLFNFLLSKAALMAYSGYLDYKVSPLEPGIYGYSILNWIYGAFYLLAGYSPFLISLFNITIGSLAAWMIYLVTYRITEHRTVSAWAMGFTILSPSQILWSADLLKEPAIELILATVIYLFVVMIQQRRWHYLIFMVLLSYPLGHLRIQMHFLALAFLALSAFLFIPRRLVTGLLLLIVVLAAAIFYRKPSRIKEDYWGFQSIIINSQIGNITTGGTYYQFIPDRYQPGASNSTPMDFREMTLSYLKALYYYLGTPNPFKRASLNKIPALPQMFLWYFLMIFFLFPGTLYLLRYHFRSSGVIFIFLLVFTSGLALFTGNEGTAFRQRDMLTPFFFIPIAVGMINTLGWFARGAGAPVPSSANGLSKQGN